MLRRTNTSSKESSTKVGANSPSSPQSTPTAKVVRHTCGTSPFDRFWLNWDCCGLFCAGLTYGLHIYGCYAVTQVLLPPWMSVTIDGERSLTFWGKFHSFCFVVVAFLAVISHFFAMTTDPGSIPPDAEPLPDSNGLDVSNHGEGEPLKPKPRPPKRMCRRCKSYKPDRAHHCSICKRCILKMDHHCPWVNNCVGIGNHKFFLLFVFYTFVSCFYAMSLVIMRFVECLGKMEKHQPCLDQPEHLLSIIGLAVESMLFGMFTCCMVIDQWDVVSTNVTHIDRLKGELSMEDLEGRAGIHEVFGSGNGKGKKSGFRPDWLSPFVKVCFPEDMHNDIMGFCRPCSRVLGVKKEKDQTFDSSGDIV